VLSGFGAPENKLHAPNENMPIERYIQGIKFAATIFQEFADRACSEPPGSSLGAEATKPPEGG